MSLPHDPLRIIVVDDDPSSLLVLKSHLKRAGHCIDTAGSAAACLHLIREKGPAAFDAVVSDYWMPGGNGLELLRQLQGIDPTLAVLVATAEGEKAIVADVLRHGGVGYLDKPVGGQQLRDAVHHAARHTREQRTLRTTAAAAAALGASQRTLLEHHVHRLNDAIELFFHSEAEASGDFVSVMPLSHDRHMILISDASGHDLRAAFQSNYFHGVARGLVSSGARMEEVFAQFNSMLLSDWNANEAINLSIAACGLMLDGPSGSLHSLNCGFPFPFASDADGFAFPLTSSAGSAPLGWFNEPHVAVYSPLPTGYLLAWTDGLPDVADQLEVDPLALVHHLLSATPAAKQHLGHARDDIAAVRINLARYVGLAAAPAIPLVSRRLAGDSLTEIDHHQAWLERSLRLALPEMADEALAEVILCAREALINALEHGCQQRSDKAADLQVSYSLDTRQLNLRVSDNGGGHDFDLENHEPTAAADLLTEHRGLVMLKHLPARTAAFSRGACLAMEFHI